jgi:hypothetical protein
MIAHSSVPRSLPRVVGNFSEPRFWAREAMNHLFGHPTYQAQVAHENRRALIDAWPGEHPRRGLEMRPVIIQAKRREKQGAHE